MEKTCKQCLNHFSIRPEDLEFYDKVSPIIAGKKYDIPAPTLCPDCRQQRRLAWRNERVLHWRTCDATGERILSVFSPNSPYKVYNNDYWYSDQWDPRAYGREFDFSRSFFAQFDELLKTVPQIARSALSNVNSEYVNQCGWCKNCYLLFEADGNEDCAYSGYIYDSKNCFDDTMCFKSELCFDSVNIQQCYRLIGSMNCENSSDAAFLKNCIGTRNSFGCINLRNKEYWFFNQPLGKEAYDEKMKSIDLSDGKQYQEWKQKSAEFFLQFPHQYMTGHQNEDSLGDYLTNTQRCYQCFEVQNAQDCAYVGYARNINHVYDMNVFGAEAGVSFSYELHEAGAAVRNVLFCDQVFDNVSDLLYSKLCVGGSRSLFGCVAMKRAQYCIFNRQYTKEEYEILVPKIIEHMKKTGEWGEFFPMELSPFGYNETVAQELYPLSREEVLKKGWKWADERADVPQVEKVIDVSQLPNELGNIPDDILNWAIRCEVTGKPFRIIPQELKFYREQGLPIPRRHPDQRHKDRMELKNPRRLWDRDCDKCGLAIQTSYEQGRPEIMYCEDCYLKEVY
jgi:hypothetical protein